MISLRAAALKLRRARARGPVPVALERRAETAAELLATAKRLGRGHIAAIENAVKVADEIERATSTQARLFGGQ